MSRIARSPWSRSTRRSRASARKLVHKRANSYKRGATLLLRPSADSQVITDPKAIATEHVGGLNCEFPAGDFFQNNPFILPAFTDYVREQAVADGARFLVDAYCGSGLFTLTAAPAFERATGIEVSEGSIRWAKQNAASNQITTVSSWPARSKICSPASPSPGRDEHHHRPAAQR